MILPNQPKIYHITPLNSLESIIRDEQLWCDAEIAKREITCTKIGMNHIKQRRLKDYKNFKGTFLKNRKIFLQASGATKQFVTKFFHFENFLTSIF